MTKYDIAITLFTIVYGLMLTDLFLSFHKMIRARAKITWHWLPLLAAWNLFLIILKNWWDLAFFQGSADWMNILFFLAYGHLLLIIFLLVSTALPDDILTDKVDLKTYYFSNNSYFWGLMSAVIFISVIISTLKQLNFMDSMNTYNLVANFIFFVLTVTLAITKKYRVHAFLVIFFVAGVILEILNKAI